MSHDDFDPYEKEDDDFIEYHIKATPDQCSITLTIVAETPISQGQYEAMLLGFVDDLRKGKASGGSEWVLDDSTDNMQ